MKIIIQDSKYISEGEQYDKQKEVVCCDPCGLSEEDRFLTSLALWLVSYLMDRKNPVFRVAVSLCVLLYQYSSIIVKRPSNLQVENSLTETGLGGAEGTAQWERA